MGSQLLHTGIQDQRFIKVNLFQQRSVIQNIDPFSSLVSAENAPPPASVSPECSCFHPAGYIEIHFAETSV